MDKYTCKTKAAARAAGTKTATRLCQAWRRHRKNPESTGARDALAREVIAELRHYRKLGPLFSGHEDDVVSRASTLLVDSYLPGNPALAAATRRGDWARVEEELRRSLKGALDTAKRRVGDLLIDQRKLGEKLRKSVLGAGEPTQTHPSLRESLWDLPVESQSLVVRDMLRQGVESESISPKAAELVRTMMDHHRTQAAAAKAAGMSARAAHRHIGKVRKYLRKKRDSVELAFL